jgi:hypothetical protein
LRNLWCMTFAILSVVGEQQADAAPPSTATEVSATVLEEGLRHLRSGPVREWSGFPDMAQAATLDVRFRSTLNEQECALFLRQQDVKQVWLVQLNGQKLGELTRDENDLIAGFPIPAGVLKNGDNRLQISARSAEATLSDDIRVGSIRLERRPLKESLTAGGLDIEVRDATTDLGLPCRITLLNANGALPALGTASSESMAIRPGLAYLATGRGQLKLPAGIYTIFAGRGFEYSLARQEVTVVDGQTARVALSIRREVPTEGYVSCDTHVHNLTHSGHGDATIAERMLTLAGEGIELPVATDHNLQIDYEGPARALGVRQHFTPVVGNEVTTGRGHFNIFPVPAGEPPPNHRLGNWPELFAEMVGQVDPAVIVLNHAQDLHAGVRPFGPKLFNAVVAEHAERWPDRLNAMEVVNSGATQTDPLQLFHNWMALLNRGRMVAPIGSSDSHDVGRHFVGQARTYIRCDDRDPGGIPVRQAIDSLQHGRVLVSYGLLTELVVNDQFRSGDLVPTGDQPYRLAIRILGPAWVRAERLLVFANGQLIREVQLPTTPPEDRPLGVLWSDVWDLPRPNHDVHLVAIAIGPGINQAYWRTAKPYQPVSPDEATYVLGCSGAVWLDVDGDDQPTSARAYAERLYARHRDDVPQLLAALSPYDAAVAAHVVHLQVQAGLSPVAEDLQQAWRSAPAAARSGYQKYVEAWRDCELARRPPINPTP